MDKYYTLYILEIRNFLPFKCKKILHFDQRCEKFQCISKGNLEILRRMNWTVERPDK